MVKIEIDLNKEMEEIIQKQVERELSIGGILPFIKETIKEEVNKKIKGTKGTLASLHSEVAGMKSNIKSLREKIDKTQ